MVFIPDPDVKVDFLGGNAKLGFAAKAHVNEAEEGYICDTVSEHASNEFVKRIRQNLKMDEVVEPT